MYISITRRKKGICGTRMLVVLLALFASASCTKFVEVPPPVNFMSSANVFINDEAAIAVLTGIYTDMSKTTNSSTGGFTGLNGLSVHTGLSADELTYHDGLSNSSKYIAFYTNNLAAIGSVTAGTEYWTPLYRYVFRSNSAIEGLNDSESGALTPSIHKLLLGEAKFMRALCYFYLTNLYGDIPLVTTSDYKVNTLLSRTSSEQIYQQIVTDLEEARELLSESYQDSKLLQATTERIRPNKWAATALLARVYLYQKNYAKAEASASVLIENSALYELLPLNNVFLKNSKESIWQLQPVTTYFNTEEARVFIVPANGPNTNNPVYLNRQFLRQFEPGDKRAVYGNWIDSTIYKINATTSDTVYYPYKYKKNLLDSAIAGSTGMQKMTEYQVVLRLGEQYLIRAEARARQNKITEAAADLNTIRVRAGLGASAATSQASLIDAILHERAVELFSEWGHRWFDLKRTGKVDEVMTVSTPIKSSGSVQWRSFQQLYPIPLESINRAPNMTQNPGY